jgi:guanylate kinase
MEWIITSSQKMNLKPASKRTSSWSLRNSRVPVMELLGKARQVRAHSKEALLVFLSPPSWDELVARLEARGSDSPERRAQRLELARQELAAAVEFDHVIVNDEVERVVEALVLLAPNQRALSGPSF